MKGTNKNSVSLAGEFAVLSQLSLGGYVANMTLGHTKGVDILVYNPKNEKTYQLEVKTSFAQNRKKPSVSNVHGRIVSSWIMNKQHERIASPKLFYCFVKVFDDSRSFNFYIVPSKVVARYVAAEHKHWLRVKKKESKRIKDSDMRQFRLGFKHENYAVATPAVEQYENNWDFAD